MQSKGKGQNSRENIGFGFGYAKSIVYRKILIDFVPMMVMYNWTGSIPELVLSILE